MNRPSGARLVLQGLKRQYWGAARPALRGMNLTVEPGETLVLVGPSGCGKSTALRLIAGLDTPDGGKIELDGRDLASIAPQDRDVAMVFQGYALYPHMTVAENIAFPLKMRGVAKPERMKKVQEAAERLGIAALLDRRPTELSGGERQRVAMGRALVRNPRIFLFDEPLSNLDAALRASLRVEIAKLMRSLGSTAIYVTHDQVEAMTLGDRIAVMREGLVEQEGSPRTIYEKPASSFVASFLGSPSINLLRAPVRDGVVHLGEGTVFVPEQLRGSEIALLGFRPESISVRTADEDTKLTGLSFVARVGVAEPLGAETILHCERDGAPAGSEVLRAKVSGFFDPELSDTVRLVVEGSKLLWFDPETERRIDVAS